MKFSEYLSAETSQEIFVFFVKLDYLGFGMVKLGSEGAYLHKKCGTDAFRYLPGSKTPVKN